VPGFERLLALHNGNLPAFYGAVRDLTKKPRAERHALLCTSPPEQTPASSGATSSQ
jgi:predicted aminopeptidase